MSGGHFDYKQFAITTIIDSIKQELLLQEKGKPEYGEKYSHITLLCFERAVAVLTEASVYAQRIDWLLSGDDSEESFHSRLQNDLADEGLTQVL